MKKNSFFEWATKNNPQLISEWDYQHNSISITDVTIGSTKKVFWKCSLGHSWQATIYSRKAGSNCPYCSNQRVLPGFNDLASNNPRLAAEWNYEKNGDLSPDEIVSKSNRKVWWKCENGHEWQSSPGNRIRSGCPYCSNQKVLSGYNDLVTLNPQLAKEWNYEKNGSFLPSMIAPKSNRKVWWKCENGHEWQNSPNHRKNNGCPYCGNQLLLSGYNDLATTHPSSLSEWDYEKNNGIVDPHNVQAGSEKKVWWVCPKGHSYQMQIDLKVKYGYKCPYCSKGRHVSFPEKAIAFYFQKIDHSAVEGFSDDSFGISEIDVFLPNKKIGIEYDGKRWHNGKTIDRDIRKNKKCRDAGITLYRIRENGCAPIPDSNSIDCYYDPNDTKSFEKIIQALIQEIYDVEIVVSLEDDRIDIYAKIDAWFDEHSGANLDKKTLSEWDYGKNKGLLPEQFSENSHKKVWWRCSRCGGSWTASLANRTQGRGCPYCSGHQLLRGYNDLASLAPSILSEWDYEKNSVSPSDITAHSAQKAWWKCSNGHSYSARISNRVDLNRGCPYCAHKLIKKGDNDLATLYPNLIIEWSLFNQLSPDAISPGSMKKVWWKCAQCGYEWQATPNSRTIKKTGCPKCAAIRKGTSSKKRINQIAIDGTILNTFPSINEAANSVHRSPSAIVNACKGKTKTCGGFKWEYDDNTDI